MRGNVQIHLQMFILETFVFVSTALKAISMRVVENIPRAHLIGE